MTTTSAIELEFRRFGEANSGPHLLITAGVHGDEYLPMLAVRELIRRFESDDDLRRSLYGRVTLIPIVNRSAWQRGQRCGDDDKDLARTCPGSSEGTITEQVAAALSHKIESADFYIDLHTGGAELCVYPLAGYTLHSDPQVLEQQRSLAKAFLLPLVWGTSGTLDGRSLSVARDARVPAIYVEYLGAHRELTEIASTASTSGIAHHPLVTGCLNVMRHVGVLSEPAEEPDKQSVVEDWRHGSGHMQVSNPAPVAGFLKPRVKLGQTVNPGDVLATIVSDLGNQETHVVSREHGTVIVLREYPRANKGDAIAVIASAHEAGTPLDC